MRDWVTTLLEVCGLGLVVAGAGMAWLPAGFISAGVALVAVAWVQS